MLTPIDVKVLDKNSEYLGVPTEELMENAGTALADAILESGGKGKNILFFCGPGNNGGDGFVAAAQLRKRAEVRVVLVKPPTQINTALAQRRYEDVLDISKVLGGADEIVTDIVWADVIVDSMLGVGLHGVLREPYKTVIHLINSSEKKVISVDIPTGLGGEDAVNPDITVTFHDTKEGMNKKNSGRIVVADIGLPEEAMTHTGPGLFVHYPVNQQTSHKGDNGKLLIVGGGPYTGAPALAAMAAYRTGVDVVHVAAPQNVAGIISSYSPCIITHPMSGDTFSKEHVTRVKELACESTGVLIGPGIGRGDETREFLKKFLPKIEVPVVIDADALFLLSDDLPLLNKVQSVVTPHRREFSSMFKDSIPGGKKGKLEDKVVAASKSTGGVVLLKGQTDIIVDEKGSVLKNKTGNSGMTVGGTGDVLAGVVAGLLSKGVMPFQAAALGAFLNGCAGDVAFRKKSYGLLPTDIIEEIPHILETFL